MGATASDDRLTSADVAALETSDDDAARVRVVEKIAEGVEAGDLSHRSRLIALEIIRSFATHVSDQVREAVSRKFCRSRFLDREIVEHLARDLPHIAFPILRYAELIEDELLVELIRQGDEHKVEAIAGRPKVSQLVVGEIVESRILPAVSTLAANPGADFSEAHLARTLRLYRDNPELIGRLAHRDRLPITVVSRLIGLVSEDIQRYLLNRFDHSRAVLRIALQYAEEAALFAHILRVGPEEGQRERALRDLDAEHRLTPTLVVRLFVSGQLPLGVIGLAVRANGTVASAADLVFGRRPGGLQAACLAAGLPPHYVYILRAAVDQAGGRREGIPAAEIPAFQTEVLAAVFAQAMRRNAFHMAELLVEMFEGDSQDVLEAAMAQAQFHFPDGRA